MPEINPAIFVVDDDASVRDAISNLLESVGLHGETFASADEFLSAPRPQAPSCLILDVKLPGRNGLEVQEELKSIGIQIPIVFITAHGDVPMTSRAMKAGAVDFLAKPFQKKDLLDAVTQALERDRIQREEQAELSILRARLDTLTPREREVMDLVVTGLMNKEAAAELGLSEITVKVHRGRVMQKMEADSLASLVLMSEKLKPRSPRR
ncbi:MAG TPA: response regulator transcription factor [Candidatus Acidoferrales bacterium]|jgi:FixJ family two-component response regulator|nr:response regulator transcription factor [Candidatus Acidoferrales bacterium]